MLFMFIAIGILMFLVGSFINWSATEKFEQHYYTLFSIGTFLSYAGATLAVLLIIKACQAH
jgi:ABC-type sugar transport system permease subunit